MSLTSAAKGFYSFMKERESVRLVKESGASWPWTKDPILQEYKFTNVRREHDFTTQRMRAIYENHQSDPITTLMNCATYRYFGTYEFAEALGWLDPWTPEVVSDLAENMTGNGHKIFTGAYMVTNAGRKGDKYKIVTGFLADLMYLHSQQLVYLVEHSGSWEALISAMMKADGFGGTGFMCKEIVLDTMFTDFWKINKHCADGKPKDYDSWTPVGPGAARGLRRIVPHDEIKELGGDNEVIKIIQLLQGSYWPKEYGYLYIHDIQFQLCEYDKYLRVKNGEGKPRSKYRRK